MVPTLTGEVDAGEFGFTLAHEHLFLLSPGLLSNWPHLFDREAAVARAAAMLEAAFEAGVRTIFDVTTIDLGRDIELMLAAAAASPVRIVAATGLHLRPPGIVNRKSPDAIVDMFLFDLTEGIAGSGIRAGLIKIASGAEVGPQNEVHLRAAARAHVRSGAPIITHSDASARTGMRQVEIFREEGVDLRRVVIGHVGDTTDTDYLRKLAGTGVLLGMDRFGTGLGTTDDERVDTVARLCGEGLASSIVLSHDTSCYSDTLPWSVRERTLPHWNFTQIPLSVVPALRAKGVTDTDIRTMTVDNPRRLFLER